MAVHIDQLLLVAGAVAFTAWRVYRYVRVIRHHAGRYQRAKAARVATEQDGKSVRFD